MHVIIVTDIFGVTAAVSALAQALQSEYRVKSDHRVKSEYIVKSEYSVNSVNSVKSLPSEHAVHSSGHAVHSLPLQVTVVDPYAGQDPLLPDEASAYDYFLAHCGHEHYLEKLKSVMSCSDAPIIILGFSAGASAAWRTMAMPWPSKVVHFIGFYPGQLRNYLHITPMYPCTIIWPAQEVHFSVSDVCAQLAKYTQVQHMHTAFAHGFMNPQSRHFSAAGAAQFDRVIHQMMAQFVTNNSAT
jgi:hypothetical protein